MLRKDALLVLGAPLAVAAALFFEPSRSTGGGC
jgi:hypothetical protein